jgi:hypothetical protein
VSLRAGPVVTEVLAPLPQAPWRLTYRNTRFQKSRQNFLQDAPETHWPYTAVLYRHAQ